MSAARVHPIQDDALGNTAYLVDVGDGQAVAVDPRRDIDVYRRVAAERGLEIVAVLETHLHADFISGANELRAGGARVYAALDAKLGFEHRPVAPGERLEIGDATIDVLATPGHTPEHLAFVVRTADGVSVFSGGSLIAGGAARTDLTGPDRTMELARAQFASLRRLSALPDETMLRPTHGGGSFCSAASGSGGPRTIGEERHANALLAIDDEDEFVRRFVAGFGSYPAYFRSLRAINRTGPMLVARIEPPRRLDGDLANDALRDGAWLIDARTVAAWTEAHPVGAISIELRPAFASWLGWVVPFNEPVVLLVEPGSLDEATRLAWRIGYDRIVGWLTMADWQGAGLPIASGHALSVDDVANGAHAVLDVRQAAEFARGHIPDAEHLELGDLIAGKLPGARPVVVYCGHGERSATAASLLERQGVSVANLSGGLDAWRAAGFPVA